MGVGTFAKVSGVWKRVTRLYGKVSGTWEEADEGYAKASGTYELTHVSFAATSYTTRGVGSGSISVPAGANAIHIQYAVGGGGGATGGISYDKAGGESSGPSGGSGAYISDEIYSVTAGASYSYAVGGGGAAGNQTPNFGHPKIASAGGQTNINSLFTLGAGGGASLTGGGVQGPLASGTAGSAGGITRSGTKLTSGSYLDSSYTLRELNNSNSDLKGGPRATFNTGGNGSAGVWNGNCGGDNCRINGSNGASSYAGSVSGGAGGSSSGSGTGGGTGTRGSGGGGGLWANNAVSRPSGGGGSGIVIIAYPT